MLDWRLVVWMTGGRTYGLIIPSTFLLISCSISPEKSSFLGGIRPRVFFSESHSNTWTNIPYKHKLTRCIVWTTHKATLVSSPPISATLVEHSIYEQPRLPTSMQPYIVWITSIVPYTSVLPPVAHLEKSMSAYISISPLAMSLPVVRPRPNMLAMVSWLFLAMHLPHGVLLLALTSYSIFLLCSTD